MQDVGSLANLAVKALGSGDFQLYAQTRCELDAHFAGHRRELERLLGTAGIGEAMMCHAARLRRHAAFLQFVEGDAHRYRHFTAVDGPVEKLVKEFIEKLDAERYRLVSQAAHLTKCSARYLRHNEGSKSLLIATTTG